MAYRSVNVDGLLLHWGDRLFYEPVQGRRAPRASRMQWPGGSKALRAQIVRTVKKVPEVMVKITNRPGAQNGMAAIRAHLQYISRNGKVELEDQNGECIDGRHAVCDLAEMWSQAGRGIPEQSPRREAFNVMLSMPPGTDRAGVRNAARVFAQEEFADNFSYVFAAHDDEDHPHVHVVVLARGRDGRRLNPRKADLQRWRERFAHELRQHGVDANATPRRTRGVTQRYERQDLKHMRARGIEPQNGRVPVNPHSAFQAHLAQLTAWRGMAAALAESADAEDRRLAVQVTDFVRDMPVVVETRDVVRPESTPAAPKRTSPGVPSGGIRKRRKGPSDVDR